MSINPLVLFPPKPQRSYWQGDRRRLTDEPVTLNATEGSMALVWGVAEEIMRLTDMHFVPPRAMEEGVSGRAAGYGEIDDDAGDEENEEVRSVLLVAFAPE